MNVVSIASRPAGSISAVASIVHDLRNPLATIYGSAEILVRSGLSQPQVDRIARNMYNASVRMREMLEELLDQSRGAEKNVEPSDLRGLIQTAVDRIAVSAEFQSVQIVQTIQEDLVIPVSRHSVLRVLINLLVNALEVMPNGGAIRISAVSERRSVLIQVRDTGPGIAPEIRDRLFQPFVTAGKAKGIGLGLASSRQTVIDHGGDMWAASTSAGACFSFRLPRNTSQRTASC